MRVSRAGLMAEGLCVFFRTAEARRFSGVRSFSWGFWCFSRPVGRLV